MSPSERSTLCSSTTGFLRLRDDLVGDFDIAEAELPGRVLVRRRLQVVAQLVDRPLPRSGLVLDDEHAAIFIAGDQVEGADELFLAAGQRDSEGRLDAQHLRGAVAVFEERRQHEPPLLEQGVRVVLPPEFDGDYRAIRRHPSRRP